jgi:uncharacterized Zn finger protein (UPF0148 family)
MKLCRRCHRNFHPPTNGTLYCPHCPIGVISGKKTAQEKRREATMRVKRALEWMASWQANSMVVRRFHEVS